MASSETQPVMSPVAGFRKKGTFTVSTANQHVVKSAGQVIYKLLDSQNNKVLDRGKRGLINLLDEQPCYLRHKP